MTNDHSERLVPSDAPHSALVDHFARYLFAAKALGKQKNILDAACGVGYGSNLLSEICNANVVGVDISSDAITRAQSSYNSDKLRFRCNSIEALSKDVFVGYSAIVSFETIEHVSNPEDVLRVFSNLIDRKGICIMSVPNDIGLGVENPYHLTKYDEAKFVELCKRHFPYIKFFYQNYGLSSSIWSMEQSSIYDRTLPVANEAGNYSFHDKRISAVKPAAFIAVASHTEESINLMKFDEVTVDSRSAWVDDRELITKYEFELNARIQLLERELGSSWTEAQRLASEWQKAAALLTASEKDNVAIPQQNTESTLESQENDLIRFADAWEKQRVMLNELRSENKLLMSKLADEKNQVSELLAQKGSLEALSTKYEAEKLQFEKNASISKKTREELLLTISILRADNVKLIDRNQNLELFVAKQTHEKKEIEKELVLATNAAELTSVENQKLLSDISLQQDKLTSISNKLIVANQQINQLKTQTAELELQRSAEVSAHAETTSALRGEIDKYASATTLLVNELASAAKQKRELLHTTSLLVEKLSSRSYALKTILGMSEKQ